ncbi:YfgM family protein [Pseudidiomarina sp.]|uniref:YfgM family protein n=1 Tax=Pseudidiomarina sp. TaxID=2081707 RepID=UPI00299D3C95|nr:tetratricopeptide repeat protein [Pseudidiomarina sp.]MDX1706533.1 tetratricopeptide repeat protein [Pseudidiomarina sp.]
METEDQQVQRIKDFWHEHGKGIIAGLVIGFGLFYGWRYYDAHTMAQKEAASEQFESLVASLEAGTEGAQVDAQNFIKNNSDDTYAHLTAFELARQAVAAGELATAVTALQAVRDNASGELQAVADVRQARVLLAQEQHDAALNAIAETSEEGFAAMVAELRGDILLAKGDQAGARAAYQAAIDASENTAPLAEIKLNSIPAES